MPGGRNYSISLDYERWQCLPRTHDEIQAKNLNYIYWNYDVRYTIRDTISDERTGRASP
jgi:hypothetical protein